MKLKNAKPGERLIDLPTTLRDDTKGLKINIPGGSGGYFTPDGKAVTFWYE